MIWIWIVLGVLVSIFCWRVAFRYFLKEMASSYRDIEAFDVVMCILLTSMIFWVVPAALLFVGIWKGLGALSGSPDASGVARMLGGESRSQKIKRLERERVQREQEIERLEKELQIQ